MTAPSETPLTENLQKLADDISVKCGVATVQAAIRIYLRQLAPHAKQREGAMLLEKSLEQMERYLTALAESRAECERLRTQSDSLNTLNLGQIKIIAKLQSDLREAETSKREAYDHLMNMQPHIAQLPEQYRPFIDSHVDAAMRALSVVVRKQ